MLERRRQRRQYNAVPGSDEADLELGEGHESGVVDGSEEDGAGPSSRTLEEEVDNWDENALDDWDDEDAGDADAGGKANGNGAGSGDIGDAKRD